MGVLVKNDDKKKGMNKWALRRLLSATLVSEARAENANVDTSNWLLDGRESGRTQSSEQGHDVLVQEL